MPALKPNEIEPRSMEIIEELLPPGGWTPMERVIVKRLVHTSGDPGIAAFVRFHPAAIESALEALRRGASVFTDVNMVRIGVDAARLRSRGGVARCGIDDPQVVEAARASGRTRARTAMRTFGHELDGAVLAIGNAPTALREVIELAQEGIARPALAIGMPVGFVDAAESKQALMESGLPYIAIEGTRGGSPLAAATVNALLRLLEAPGV